MPKFLPGDTVAVPVSVQPGAFADEFLVTVGTLSGNVSGFVRAQDIVEPGVSIQAKVRESTDSVLSVVLSGSYFTTNGLARLSAEWARNNVRAIA